MTSTGVLTIAITFNLYSCNHPFANEFFNWRQLNDALISVYKRCPSVVLDVAFYYLLNLGEPPDVCDDARTRLAPVLEAGMRVNIVRRVCYNTRMPILFWQQ